MRLILASAVLLCGLLGSASAPVRAQERAAPFLFGVGAHFAFPLTRGYVPRDMAPLLKDLGVDSFRDDVDADAFTHPSAYRPIGSTLDRLNAAVYRRFGRPVLILRGPVIGEGASARQAPRDAAEREAFADFAADLEHHTRPYAPLLEIWNEWNMQWRENPHLLGLLAGNENPDYSPENYVAMARVVFDRLKRENPGALVLTGSIGDDPDWVWTRRALDAGLAETGDGISVHFYNHCQAPEQRTAENLVARTEDFRRTVEEKAGPDAPPLYVTEFGWPNDNGACGIDLRRAATNVAQYALWSATVDWIRGVWVYELRNSGKRPEDREDNFGLHDYANRPKPAACAYREAIALSREIGGGRFRETAEGVRWLEGEDAEGRPVWAFWTTAADTASRLDLPDNLSGVTGRELCAEGNPAGEDLVIGAMPLVLRPPAGSDPAAVVVAPAAAP
ncbi:hypothetical protein [Aureimonas sp. SK2]|uniref:hypothetical protein n=1 Tax=Aureimonas sp. SK2 TaxID=3015992 RepID=UPI0024441ACC|nr:hypothetical protein [Aureimonas sp. SK2]